MHARVPRSTWPLQDAKNSLSEVVKAAANEPQSITKHGKRVAVLVDADDFDRFYKAPEKKWRTFAEALLAIPQAPEDEEEDIFESPKTRLRDVKF
ncbi:MAG TPA: type II toxin-antitoxin system Phd/YefM family antitoxin [Rhizomicrobium sp.]|jgi:prevent-host-death family protein